MASDPEQRRSDAYDTVDQFRELERRVRDIEDTINKVSGVLSVARWIVPPLLVVGGGVLLFFLGRAFG